MIEVQDDIPEFVQPKNINDLTDEELDVMIEGMRVRRMKSLNIYQQTKLLQIEKEQYKVGLQLDKKMEKYKKLYDRSEKLLEDMEKTANEIRAYRLQLGADPL